MNYKVLSSFTDKNTGKVYRKGEPYPSDASKERLKELSTKDNAQEKVLIQEVESDEKKDDDKAESKFPKHSGGGWYELSNGEKVQGKDEALEAEKELK